MNRLLLFAFISLFATQTSFAQFGKLLDKAKSTGQDLISKDKDDNEGLDISGGLKEALDEGVKDAVSTLSAKDGYLKSAYKIEAPEEAQSVINKVKRIPGFKDVDEKLVAKMNEAAELAAKKATPIFVAAIKEMSFKDAQSILFGEEDAGTRYLESSARTKLYKEFMPIIVAALEEVNATKYWSSVVSKYNAIPLTKDVNPELDDHVNNKALDGLFSLIQQKEGGIRTDVSQRTSPLLGKVFGQLD